MFQSLLINFACLATFSSKESFQLFGTAVAIFLEEGECCWYRDYCLVRVRRLVRDCCLVQDCRLVRVIRVRGLVRVIRVRGLVRVRDGYLRLWGSGPVLALNREDL